MDYLSVVIFVCVVYIFRKYDYKVWNIIHLLPRDLFVTWKVLQFKICYAFWSYNNYTLPKIFTKIAKEKSMKPAIKYNNKNWTFEKIDIWSNKIAQYFLNLNVHNVNVMLIMNPNPEFICVFLGLMKLHIPVTIINDRADFNEIENFLTFRHYKIVIFGSEFRKKYFYDQKNLEFFDIYSLFEVSLFDESDSIVLYKSKITNLTEAAANIKEESFYFNSKINNFNSYLFSFADLDSSTEVRIKNSEFLYNVLKMYYLCGFKSNDIIYSPLSITHTFGSIWSLGMCFISGSTVVLKDTFSPISFWNDTVQNNCTILQYSGNTCQYLLMMPEQIKEYHHSVRFMFGHGLNNHHWEQFLNRFNVEKINEFFWNLKSNEILVNSDATHRSIGVVPKFFPNICPITIAEVVPGNKRDEKKNVKYVKCKNGKTGLLLIKKDPESYSKDENLDNVLTNVFQKGDCYIRTSDLVYTDRYNYLYYFDDINYIFLYRNQIISSTKVEAIISGSLNYKNVAFYPVKVNNEYHGMIAIEDTCKTLNMTALLYFMKSSLKFYEIPSFVRISNGLPINEGFSIRKDILQKNGISIFKTDDKIFYYDSELFVYLPINNNVYEQITKGFKKINL